jgi:CheY-like chemotaxis protein
MRPVRLDEVARHCVDVLRGSERLGARRLLFEADAALVNADPARLEQIVANLLSNALKFTSPNGTIRVSVRLEGVLAVLRVQDDGIGIAPELLPQVFDLFTQGERRLDRQEGGLGVGLTLVQKLAELQGGNAQARSDGPGKGSEFIVRFIPTNASDQPAANTVYPHRPASKFRVLIIEDNADAREALQVALTADGHEVHEAADGEAGVEVAERVRPDLVLVDIGLPKIDGYEVARRLRARQLSLGKRWRLIALTGYGQPEDVRQAMDAGFDAHLVKPVFPAALHDAMTGIAVPPAKAGA